MNIAYRIVLFVALALYTNGCEMIDANPASYLYTLDDKVHNDGKENTPILDDRNSSDDTIASLPDDSLEANDTLPNAPDINASNNNDTNGTMTDTYLNDRNETLAITPINHAPRAYDDNISGDEDTTITIDVLANDHDDENDSLNIQLLNQPQHGVATVTDHTITYTPAADYYGDDTFEYTLNDGTADSAPAIVHITIHPVNDTPTLHLASSRFTAEQYQPFTLSPTVTSETPDRLSFELLNAPQWMEINQSTGVISGTPMRLNDVKRYKGIQVRVVEEDGDEAISRFDLQVNRAQKMVVIRIEFDDYPFEHNATVWAKKIFGYNEHELNGYYREISYGSFRFAPANETDGATNDGIITIALEEEHPNPGSDATAFLDELSDAIEKADPAIDFSQFDTDEDGALSSDELQIVFLVAGGESATGATPGVWAQNWCFDDNVGAPVVDGVKVMECRSHGNYVQFGEKHFDADEGHDATIGVIAHELGHSTFHLPDLYDIDGSSAGIGSFGLMGWGSWGKKAGEIYGETPVHMSGWSKIKCGFVEPVVIDQEVFDLNVVGTASQGYTPYKIETDNPQEYFLVETREAGGYDLGLGMLSGAEDGFETSGIAIWHIDENQKSNQDEHHKLVDLEEAKNAGLDDGYFGHINNLFFKENVDRFTPDTAPNSDQYDGTNTGIAITNISESNATMRIDVTF